MYSWGLVTSQTVFHETHQNLMMLCLGDNKGEELTGAQLRAEKDDAKKERNKIVCSWLSSPPGSLGRKSCASSTNED